jgi:hypothetical protein
MEIVRVSDKCVIKQETTGKIVEAVVFNFKDKQHLTVMINRSVKLHMNWNGRVYEGRMAGLDFVSDGPEVTKARTGR